MLFPIPIVRYNETLDQDEKIWIDLNPMHVVTVEPHEARKNACVVWLVNDGTIEVEWAQKKFNEKMTEFVHENVVQKFYKHFRDNSN